MLDPRTGLDFGRSIQAPNVTANLLNYLGMKGEYPLILSRELVPVVIVAGESSVNPPEGGSPVKIESLAGGVTFPVGGEIAVRNPGTGAEQGRLTVATEDERGYGLIPGNTRAVSYPSCYNTYFGGRTGTGYWCGRLAVTDAYVIRIRQFRFATNATEEFYVHLNPTYSPLTNTQNRVPTLLDSRTNEISTVGFESTIGFTSSNVGTGIIHKHEAQANIPGIWTPEVPIILREDDELLVRDLSTGGSGGLNVFVDYEIWNTQG